MLPLARRLATTSHQITKNHALLTPCLIWLRNLHMVVLCCGLILYPYPSGLLYWHWGNRTIAPMPVKYSWRIWLNRSHETTSNSLYIHNKEKHNKKMCIFYGIYCIWYNHNKAKHNKTMCIFHGMYCICKLPCLSCHPSQDSDCEVSISVTGIVCRSLLVHRSLKLCVTFTLCWRVSTQEYILAICG